MTWRESAYGFDENKCPIRSSTQSRQSNMIHLRYGDVSRHFVTVGEKIQNVLNV